MIPLSLFHVIREDGSISGPHHAGFLCRGLAAGELSPETSVRLEGTTDWLPLSRFAADLETLRRRPAAPAWKTESGPSRSQAGHTARKCQGTTLAVLTVALSIPASVFLHRQMPVAGFTCLIAMAGCLAGALVLLDPLRK